LGQGSGQDEFFGHAGSLVIEIAVYEWTNKNGRSRTNQKARMKDS